MTVIVAASSLHRALQNWENNRRREQPGVKSIPGLILNPRADPPKKVVNPRRSRVHEEESIIIWHDAMKTSITHHPRDIRALLSKEELICELLKVGNPSGIVYVQRKHEPYIYQYPATKSGVKEETERYHDSTSIASSPYLPITGVEIACFQGQRQYS